MKKSMGLSGKINRKLRRFAQRFLFNKGEKIFCVSLQRTGTTSTGQFFKDHGYLVATYSVSKKNLWTLSHTQGDYEKVFKSKEFINSQVFEDDPWWLNDFYKVLYHRFPKSKFILLERDPNKWFDSMVTHSKGRTLGNTHIHCAQYQRLGEFHETASGYENAYTNIVDNALPLGEEQREHYTNFYEVRNKEVKLFFQRHDMRRLFNARLEDNGLWQKMGHFFRINVENGYSVHLNRSS